MSRYQTFGMRGLAGAALMLTAWVALEATSRADWPAFQGGNQDAVATATQLARTWPEGGPKVLWTVPVDAGYGGAAIIGEEVYILDRQDDQKDLLRCLNLKTGREVWSHAEDSPGKTSFPGTRGVPTIEGDFVWAAGCLGGVYCFNKTTRELVWKVDLMQAYPTDNPPRWGFAYSPLVHGNLVYVVPQTDQVGLVALDKRTGKEVWKTGFFGQTYSTAVVRRIAGRDVLLILTNKREGEGGQGFLLGYEPATGAQLLEYTGYSCRNPIPLPVALGEDRLFLTGGYDAGSQMLKVTADGDKLKAEKLYELEKGSQIHIPVTHGDYLYMSANENANQRGTTLGEGGLMCLDPKDGAIKWRTGSAPNMGFGALLLAGDLLLALDGGDGTLRLIDPNHEGYRQLGETKPFAAAPTQEAQAGTSDSQGKREGKGDGRGKGGGGGRDRGEQIWAPMAISGEHVILRSQKELKCLELPKREG